MVLVTDLCLAGQKGLLMAPCLADTRVHCLVEATAEKSAEQSAALTAPTRVSYLADHLGAYLVARSALMKGR